MVGVNVVHRSKIAVLGVSLAFLLGFYLARPEWWQNGECAVRNVLFCQRMLCKLAMFKRTVCRYVRSGFEWVEGNDGLSEYEGEISSRHILR